MADFIVDGVAYPFPTQVRLGDATLVRELTGLEIEELDDASELQRLTAYLAITVWQANPKWSRLKAARFVEAVDISRVEIETDDDDPPAARAEDPPLSPASSTASTTTPADTSEDLA